MKLADSYYQRADFHNAGSTFQRCKKLLEGFDSPGVRYMCIAIDQQLAAISLLSGRYSEAQPAFEELLEKAHGISDSRKWEVIRELRRWKALTLLHQGQYKDAAEELGQLLEEIDGSPGTDVMFNIQVQKDYSLALAHLGPYSQVRKQIARARTELQTYIQHYGSPSDKNVIQNTQTSKDELAGASVSEHGTGTRLDIPTKDKATLHRKLRVKQDYLRFTEAAIYSLWGFYKEALQDSDKALRGLEQSLGTRHIKTLECASLNAKLLAQNFQVSQAEKICNKTLNTMKKELGPHHPHTLETTGHLIYILKLQYRLAEAMDTANSLRRSTRKNFDKQHPQTLNSSLLLSEIQLSAGDYFAAVIGLRYLVSISEPIYGDNNLATLLHNSTYARALCQFGAIRKAEEVAILTLRRQRKALILPKIQNTSASDAPSSVCGDFRGSSAETLKDSDLIRSTLEAIRQDADDLRIHPSLLFTLETLALVETNKGDPDWTLAEDIMDCCWQRKKLVVGKKHAEHAFSLAAEFELAMVLQDETDGDERLEQKYEHLKHVCTRRMAVFEETHPEVLAVQRELIITSCKLGQWRGLPKQSTHTAKPSTRSEPDDPDHEPGQSTSTSDIDTLGVPFGNDIWAMVEEESTRILSMNEMQLGDIHPETLKSHFWLFTLQLLVCKDVVPDSMMQDLLSRLRHPRMLSQRIADSVHMRHNMAFLLSQNNHFLEALSILRQIPGDIAGSDLNQDGIIKGVLAELRQATDQRIIDIADEAKPIYKPKLDELLVRSEKIKSESTYDEAASLISELIRHRELLYGPENPVTLRARKMLASRTWQEGRMVEAIGILGEVREGLKKTKATDFEQEEVANIYNQWSEQLRSHVEAEERRRAADLEQQT